MTTTLKNKKGKIIFSREVLFSLEEDVLKALFSVFYPIHIEPNFLTDNATYYGVCHDFDEIEEGTAMPEYTCTVVFSTKSASNIGPATGVANVTFKRV